MTTRTPASAVPQTAATLPAPAAPRQLPAPHAPSAHDAAPATTVPPHRSSMSTVLGTPALVVATLVGVAWMAYAGYFLFLCYRPLLAQDPAQLSDLAATHGATLACAALAGVVAVMLTVATTMLVRLLDHHE